MIVTFPRASAAPRHSEPTVDSPAAVRGGRADCVHTRVALPNATPRPGRTRQSCATARRHRMVALNDIREGGMECSTPTRLFRRLSADKVGSKMTRLPRQHWSGARTERKDAASSRPHARFPDAANIAIRFLAEERQSGVGCVGVDRNHPAFPGTHSGEPVAARRVERNPEMGRLTRKAPKYRVSRYRIDMELHNR